MVFDFDLLQLINKNDLGTVYLMSEGWLTLFKMSSFVRLLMVASSNDHSSNKPLVKHTGPILKQITVNVKS